MYLGGITRSSDTRKLYSFESFTFLAVWRVFGLYDFSLSHSPCESQSIAPGCRATGSSTNVLQHRCSLRLGRAWMAALEIPHVEQISCNGSENNVLVFLYHDS